MQWVSKNKQKILFIKEKVLNWPPFRLCLGRDGVMPVHRAAIVGRKDDKGVLEHAFCSQGCGDIANPFIHAAQHPGKDLSVLVGDDAVVRVHVRLW